MAQILPFLRFLFPEHLPQVSSGLAPSPPFDLDSSIPFKITTLPYPAHCLICPLAPHNDAHCLLTDSIVYLCLSSVQDAGIFICPFTAISLGPDTWSALEAQTFVFLVFLLVCSLPLLPQACEFLEGRDLVLASLGIKIGLKHAVGTQEVLDSGFVGRYGTPCDRRKVALRSTPWILELRKPLDAGQ